jgi:hypothetical protein
MHGSTNLIGWMDAWRDVWMAGWLDGWMDGWCMERTTDLTDGHGGVALGRPRNTRKPDASSFLKLLPHSLSTILPYRWWAPMRG